MLAQLGPQDLDRIEFRGLLGQKERMQTRLIGDEVPDFVTGVNGRAVLHQHNRPRNISQQRERFVLVRAGL